MAEWSMNRAILHDRCPGRAGRWAAGVVALCLLAGACALAENYVSPDGPRHAGDHVIVERDSVNALTVVTYNLEHARQIDKAIAVLQGEPLRHADVILMQEMDREGTDRIARALELRYVYYPGSVHSSGRDFGTAVLSPWPIVADYKLLLPHADPFNNRRRIATAAVIDVLGQEILAYSVHTTVISLGLRARLEQAETVLRDAADFPGPVVIGGDFNTGDRDSEGQLINLFSGYGMDWVTREVAATAAYLGLGVRLDYIFSKHLEPRASGAFDGDAGSDHRPVWALVSPPATATQ
jgi:endonuclease/exonuclease/phosphatase (EEP) superfamily protein YafD